MDKILLTQPYLESLSTDELFRMVDQCGLDIPAGLDRVFIIEELLDLAAENREEDEDPLETTLMDADFLESAALPKQYNITFIEAIIRDPLWVFVFWEVKGSDREVFENAGDFGGYYLKVAPWGREEPVVREQISPEAAEREGVFVVPVGVDDAAWYLGFPPAGESGVKDSRYKVELCAGREGEEILLAVSAPVKLPDLPELPRRNQPTQEPVALERQSSKLPFWRGMAGSKPPQKLPRREAESWVLNPPANKNHEGAYGNPLVCLSGAGDFRIIRNGDRQSRIKKQENSSAG